MAKAKKTLQHGQRIRVVIIDDSVVIRQLVTHALQTDRAIEVVGVAANGSIALSKIAQLNPDAVTLAIEMREVDGSEALRRIRRDHPDVRVIMFSALTEQGASATLEALALGADDYVTKFSNEGSSLARLREELIPKIKQFFAFPEPRETKPALPPQPVLLSKVTASPGSLNRAGTATARAPSVVVLGISTGGPAALARIMPHFPANFPLPFLIVQHMPPLFTKLLADRLNAACALTVREAIDGAPVEPGVVWIAPGDFHMRVAMRGKALRIKLDQGPAENSCRPSVDVLFASVAELFGPKVLAAVLTGMGRDGQRGSALLKAKGACVIAQDEASSVVWGMPGSVVNEGLADAVLPLDEIPREIMVRAAGCSASTGMARQAAPASDVVSGRAKEAICPR